MLFSEKIRLLRRERGILQRKLAQAIGVDVPMYSRYEHGERRPKRAQVVKLAKLLKTDPDELVALWLAEDAMGAIGHDKMSARAAVLLRETLDGVDTAALSQEEIDIELEPEPAAPAPQVVVTATPAIDPAILKAPHCDPALRNLVKKLGYSNMPQYHCGDACKVMAQIEDKSIDCIVTSPPYWHLREYKVDSLTTKDASEFIDNLLRMTAEAHRVLKDEGSLWINMADAYQDASMQALPWRLAIKMMDLQGWMLRNDIIWNKQQGTIDGMQNHMRNEHEYMFHFVKCENYYYNDDQLRRNYGVQDKATGAKGTGERYQRNIATNNQLSPIEKKNAMQALQTAMIRLNSGKIGSYRLYLRDKNNTPTGDESRDQEIKNNGFYIQETAQTLSMPGDVWNIAPERSETDRYVIAPQQLYKLAITATCPQGGIVLDPYCGTGTACKVAHDMGCRSMGIDINDERLRKARGRVEQQSLSLF